LRTPLAQSPRILLREGEQTRRVLSRRALGLSEQTLPIASQRHTLYPHDRFRARTIGNEKISQARWQLIRERNGKRFFTRAGIDCTTSALVRICGCFDARRLQTESWSGGGWGGGEGRGGGGGGGGIPFGEKGALSSCFFFGGGGEGGGGGGGGFVGRGGGGGCVPSFLVHHNGPRP